LSDHHLNRYKLKEDTGCWIWTGCVHVKGYGRLKAVGKDWYAHRYFFARLTQTKIPKGAFICHHCDTPTCVNPEHLYLGDQQTNVSDALNRERYHGPKKPTRGEKTPWHKLTEEDVLAIRASSKTQTELAAEYGVGQTTISDVVRRHSWTHI